MRETSKNWLAIALVVNVPSSEMTSGGLAGGNNEVGNSSGSLNTYELSWLAGGIAYSSVFAVWKNSKNSSKSVVLGFP